MSGASSETNSIEIDHRRPKLTLQPASQQDANNDEFIRSPAPRPAIARHYTSLEEHADAVQAAGITPGGGGSTPRAEERRDGFSWERRHGEEPDASPVPRPLPTPSTPPPLEEIVRKLSKEDTARDRESSITSSDTVPSRSSTIQLPAASPSTGTVPRTDTRRSSFNGLTKGVLKHVPDMRIFLPAEKELEIAEGRRSRDGGSKGKTGRRTKFDLPPTPTDDSSPEEAEQPADVPANKPPPPEPSLPAKGAVKDRRKLAKGEAMKLTLPLDLPNLPSRGRAPVSGLRNVAHVAPPRRLSPKTPWIHDHPPAWQTSGPATASPTIPEGGNQGGHGLLPGSDPIISSYSETPPARSPKRRSIGRIRFTRKSETRTSGNSLPPTPVASAFAANRQLGEPLQIAQTEEGSRGTGKRSSRKRWSGSWASNDSPDSPSAETNRLIFTRFLKPKRSGQHITTGGANPSKTDKCSLRRKQSVPARPDANLDTIANMPVPPAFVPPGLNRVPTPPLLDANGEVVGKLADFFFDIQGVRTHKPPQTPGSIWDSDALLMSQETNISPPTSNSDESPQGLSVTPLAHDDPKSTQPAAPAAGYLTVITPPSAAPPVPDFAQDWFRVQKNTEPPFSSARKDSMAREAEARAKLEWLVPEHLPTSPLCPLNSKYRGSGKGICPYHGARKKSLAASRMSVGSVGGKRLDGRRVSEIMDGVDEGLGSSGRWRRVCAASSP